MKIFVIGAGQVGATIVEALHDDHDVTLIDLDPARLEPLAHRYDVIDIRRVWSFDGTLRILDEM